jgi:hypothetical protein
MSLIILTDQRISELIAEPKHIPQGLCTARAMAERNGHNHKEFDVLCESENRFVIKLRQLCINPLDFSVILGYQLPGLNTIFRLRRYNGKHYHSNTLESQRFYGFHIHTATERYQTAGFRPDHFATPTDRYWDLDSAIDCMLVDCGFRSPMEESPLFRSPRP